MLKPLQEDESLSSFVVQVDEPDGALWLYVIRAFAFCNFGEKWILLKVGREAVVEVGRHCFSLWPTEARIL